MGKAIEGYTYPNMESTRPVDDAPAETVTIETVYARQGEILAEMRALRAYVESMEKKAAELASPENMMKMAEKMMGGMFG